MRYESRIRIQSFTTPATFIVNALVLPMSKNTAMLRAAKGGQVSRNEVLGCECPARQ
jgi:hypothetical protein